MNLRSLPLLCVALAALPVGLGMAQDLATGVPDEIQRFYRDRNAAATLSTPGERIALAGTEIPDSLSERLRFIHAAMKRLEDAELDPDPGMLLPGQALRVTVPATLATITGVHASATGVLEVHLLVRDLAWDDNLQYIRMYEAGKNSRSVHPSGFSPVSSREIHTWRRIGGRWLREPAGMTLLSAY